MSSVMAEEMDESNGLNDKEMCDDCDDLKVSDDHKKEIPETNHGERRTAEKPFVLKKWNCCAMWRWDCECDTCAICRVQVMDACLRCQSENRSDDCVVVWGECNHSFHNCCMSLWVQQNNRCPLCQHEWLVQRIGK